MPGVKNLDDGLSAITADIAAIKVVTDAIPNAGAMTDIMDEIEILEEHDHNITHTFGLLVPQTATAWGDPATLAPYVLTSGDDTWGTWVQLLGADDTPIIAGKTHFDPGKLEFAAASEATTYRTQIAYGDGTPAAALSANQVSEKVVTPPTALGPGAGGAPVEATEMRVVAGTKIWGRCWNAADGATLDLFLEAHEYPAGP